MVPFVQAARVNELQALLHRLRRDQLRQRDHGRGLLHSVRILGLQKCPRCGVTTMGGITTTIGERRNESAGTVGFAISRETHQTHTDILKGGMIQLPRRAVTLPLAIHRRQYLKTRSSLELLPDSATYADCGLCRAYCIPPCDETKHTTKRIVTTYRTNCGLYWYKSAEIEKKTVQRLGELRLTLYLATEEERERLSQAATAA